MGCDVLRAASTVQDSGTKGSPQAVRERQAVEFQAAVPNVAVASKPKRAQAGSCTRMLPKHIRQRISGGHPCQNVASGGQMYQNVA